jgi:hypothetical protein
VSCSKCEVTREVDSEISATLERLFLSAGIEDRRSVCVDLRDFDSIPLSVNVGDFHCTLVKAEQAIRSGGRLRMDCTFECRVK